MDIVNDTQTAMDVTGVTKAPVLDKSSSVPKAELGQLDLSKELKPSEISVEDVEEMVEALKELTQTLQTKLNFSVDAGTKNIVVKVIDKDTDEVIKQIPPESLLKLQETMQDLTGFLLSDNI